MKEEESRLAREPLDLAVDLHRRRLAVVCADRAGNEQWRRRLSNDAEGEAQLLRSLAPGDRVVIEATTAVFRLANVLEGSGATVIIADPQSARLLGMRGKKSDWRDCQALLRHLRAGEIVAVWRPTAAVRALRQLTRERAAYHQSIVRLKNRIRALLWEEGVPAEADFFRQVSRQGLAGVELHGPARAILEREWQALSALEPLKAAQEAALAEWALALPEAQRLMQIPGFGMATAVMVLGEVGEFSRFGSAKQLVSYAGLDPKVDQSDGPPRLGQRISKAGRTELRWLMVEAAWAHVRAGGAEAGLFHRLVKRGKPQGVAIVALARRLLAVAWLVMTRQENYRGLKASTYEQKLRQLAGQRPWTGEAQPTNRRWAAATLEALLGEPAPSQQGEPKGKVFEWRRPPRRAGAHAPRAVCGSTASAGGSEFPALGRSDPSEPPALAGGRLDPSGRSNEREQR